MRSQVSLLCLASAVTLLTVGCAGPEQKLGRGLRNATEFARMGEIRRSIEQTTIWENPDAGSTTGFVRGLNRSFARTGVGLYEILTFPFPSYDPLLLPDHPVYPDSYTPNRLADQTFATDTALGFSGGDIAPFVPGSRFKIFDY